MSVFRVFLARLATACLCITTPALAEDPSTALPNEDLSYLLDPGEGTSVSTGSSFSNYTTETTNLELDSSNPTYTPFQLSVVPQINSSLLAPLAGGGALLGTAALRVAPRALQALSKAPKSPTPAATVVTAVLVGTALLSESGDPQPLDPPTQEQRDARRLEQAWEFELERSHQTNQPGSLGTQPLYTTLTQAEFEEQSRLGQERLRAQLEEEECRRLGMMCVRNPAPLGGETEISGPVASTEDPKGGGKGGGVDTARTDEKTLEEVLALNRRARTVGKTLEVVGDLRAMSPARRQELLTVARTRLRDTPLRLFEALVVSAETGPAEAPSYAARRQLNRWFPPGGLLSPDYAAKGLELRDTLALAEYQVTKAGLTGEVAEVVRRAARDDVTRQLQTMSDRDLAGIYTAMSNGKDSLLPEMIRRIYDTAARDLEFAARGNTDLPDTVFSPTDPTDPHLSKDPGWLAVDPAALPVHVGPVHTEAVGLELEPRFPFPSVDVVSKSGAVGGRTVVTTEKRLPATERGRTVRVETTYYDDGSKRHAIVYEYDSHTFNYPSPLHIPIEEFVGIDRDVLVDELITEFRSQARSTILDPPPADAVVRSRVLPEGYEVSWDLSVATGRTEITTLELESGVHVVRSRSDSGTVVITLTGEDTEMLDTLRAFARVP